MGQFARMVAGLSRPKPTKPEVVNKNRAYEVRNVNDSTYFQELLTHIEAVASSPVAVGNHEAMIEQVGETNAYRKLLGKLKKDLAASLRVIESDQQRQRGR